MTKTLKIALALVLLAGVVGGISVARHNIHDDGLGTVQVR